MDPLTLSILSLIGGALLVYKAAQLVIDKFSTLIESGVIKAGFAGLLLLSMITAIPNLAVSTSAILRDVPELVFLSNVGNNIGNLTLVAGLAALIALMPHAQYKRRRRSIFSLLPSQYLITDQKLLKRDSIFLLVTSMIGALLMLDGDVSRLDGFVLLGVFGLYVLSILYKDATIKIRRQTDTDAEKSFKWIGTLAVMFFAAAAVYIGAELIVYGSQILVDLLGSDALFVGTVVVGLATVIPNAAVILFAAYQNQNDLSFGNLIGDCIASVPLTLGIMAVFNPIILPAGGIALVWLFLGANVLFFVMVFADIFQFKVDGTPDIKIEEALLLVLAYIAFLLYI